MKPQGKIFILTGPSGVGKTTIAKGLLRRYKWLQRLVTYTTRPPRPKEKDGRDYHFITHDEFERKRSAGDFFEYAEVYGQWYGNSRRDLDALLEQGKSALMVVDIQGAKTIKQKLPEARVIFLEPDSVDHLKGRIMHRGKPDPMDLKRRLETAKKEMAMKTIADFLVINREGKIGATIAAIAKIAKDVTRGFDRKSRFS